MKDSIINFYDQGQKLPISAIVVCYNEGHMLKDCLKSIQFCDQILVVDLGSADNSLEVAIKCNATIFFHKRVTVVEQVHEKIVAQTKYEWLLMTDPDERIDKTLAEDIIKMFPVIPIDVSMIRVPIIFYFKKHAMKGTVWGSANKRTLLIKKNGVTLSSSVHAGIKLKKNLKVIELPLNDTSTNIDHHFWINSYTTLFNKHNRYLLKEGEARYKKGERFAFKKFFIYPIKGFYYSFIYKKGFKDGLTGFFLSLFWAYYTLRIQLAIALYSIKQKSVIGNK